MAGSTIEVLWLEPGYWRMGKEYFDDSEGARRLQQEPYSDSVDVRSCPDWKRDEDSACTGSLRSREHLWWVVVIVIFVSRHCFIRNESQC